MKRYLTALLWLCMLPVMAQQDHNSTRTWLFGGGWNQLYDSYLSPLDYTGHGANMTMINERTARGPRCVSINHTTKEVLPRVSNYTLLDISAADATNTGNAHLYDARATVAFGWHVNRFLLFNHGNRIRLRLGGLAETSVAGSYSTRNGNNPAQGRASFNLLASGLLDYTFDNPFLHGKKKLEASQWRLRAELDVPLTGLMFSPHYGQSYYEIFLIGHQAHNVVPTYPGNAPSARAFVTLHIPARKGNFVVGYRGDVRQSNVNKIGYHNWSHGFSIGFSRPLHL